jgi:hypothetical protein
VNRWENSTEQCWLKLLYAVVVGVVIGGSGCASYSFKRGASPDAMAADEKSCRQPKEVFHTCMREKGWSVANKETVAEIARAVPVVAVGNDGTNEIAASRSASTSSLASVSDGEIKKKSSHANFKRSPHAEALPPEGTDSLPPLQVSSWWKFGGTAGGLENAIAACGDKLGDTRPLTINATVLTQATYECLKADGWYALGRPSQ